ncbi:MAG: hypothetical protein HY674_14510 [Chloroflexi bacterium]|nr:hypothetical protein [Chloroflexota bacterium]
MEPILLEAWLMLIALLASTWLAILAVIRFRRATSNQSKFMLAICILFILCSNSVALLRLGKGRGTHAVHACVNNLRQMDGAKEQWALENKKKAGDRVTMEDMVPYIKGGAPQCSAGGTYTVGAVGEAPTCSLGPPDHTRQAGVYFKEIEKRARTKDRAILASQLVSMLVLAMNLRRRPHRSHRKIDS